MVLGSGWWMRLLGLMLWVGMIAGCPQQMVKPDYSRPLPEGVPALRKITDPAELPDLKQAFNYRDNGLLQAIDRSLGWFEKPSTRQNYTVQGLTHEQAQASVAAFRQILTSSLNPHEFETRIHREFDTYTSVGWDGSGIVFFTGYYTPILVASRVRTQEFQYPLYRRPPDLEKDPVTGQTLGRRIGGSLKPYPTRAQIDYYPDRLGLVGQELVWLNNKLDRYVLQVQGSAKLSMTDGSTMYVGYAADNGAEYVSIAKRMIADGKLDKDRAGLPAIKAYFAQNPQDLDKYINQNPRYVFFQEYPGSNWPAGALGFKVEDFRSLATDKRIYPRGCITLVNTVIPAQGGGQRTFDQFMLDQDAGGAIRAPGRADIYMGIGAQAEAIAGQQASEGRLYYFLLKPERVGAWLRQGGARAPTGLPSM